MELSGQHHRLELPESLRTQLFGFRRRVWLIKLAEVCCGALFGVLLGFLATFLLDRLFDTPAWIRLGILAGAMLACAMIPLALHHWVWSHRKLDQLARLLTRTHPGVGDQLLGVIELVRSDSEQARSLVLCRAAVDQVAEDARSRDFTHAVPNPRHRQRALLAGIMLITSAVMLALYPAAAVNAWSRFLAPWSDTPRYTFTMIDSLPDEIVVPHGEPFDVNISLAEGTASQPEQGTARLGIQRPVTAALDGNRYPFSLPAQIDTGWLDVRIGDFRKQVRIEPVLRPEPASFTAEVELPSYLQRDGKLTRDVRGGTLSIVKDSQARFLLKASRELSSASIGGEPVEPRGATIVSRPHHVETDSKVEFNWQDQHGLAGAEPFTLSIDARDDEAPSIASGDLPRRKVVLDTEQLTFHITAQDDFGVKHVGMSWKGADETSLSEPAEGERIIAAGGPDSELLEPAGTFSASSLGIAPQPLELRLFVEDYFPGRERVYSRPCLLYVLDAEQHAIWLTEQLSKWHRQSLDVRDRELQLYNTNQELRQLSAAEISTDQTRRRIEKQAAAERTNGRRLTRLVNGGEQLVKQAMRNPEFGVGHLENWAGMLQVLKDISSNRMPSVAELLRKASEAPQVAQQSPQDQSPSVGQVRNAGGGPSKPGSDDEESKSKKVPGIVDVESSHQPLESGEDEDSGDGRKGQSSPRLGLPSTTLLGGGPKSDDSCPVSEKVEQAVEEQRDLLAEFEKIADELNQLLANLEGSTLVKRLKAASRKQYRIAGRLADQVSAAFGVPPSSVDAGKREVFQELASEEEESTLTVSHIMDDMQAYFERRRFTRFKTVLDEMRDEDVIGGLRQLAEDIPAETGLSMAQCEYWSDTFDRWAEDLVDPASGGT